MKTENSEAKKLELNVRRLYLYFFFQSLIFAYVIERLFGLDRGLTIQQMVYVEIIYAGAIMVLEIPTGILADTWGRRNAMILSSIFTFFEFFILIFAFDFWLFALSALLAAIGDSLESGTSNAMFYDSLKSINKEESFEKVMGRNKFYASIAGAIAALSGAYIASEFGYTINYWLSLIGVSIAIVMTFKLHEPKVKTLIEGESSSFKLKEVLTFLANRESIRFIILYGIILGAIVVYIDEFAQVYLKDIGIPVAAFGIYLIFREFLDSVGSVFAYKVKELFGYKTIFSFLIFLSGISILIASFIESAYGIIPLLLTFIFVGISEPLTSGYLHHRTESKHRATVESFASFSLRLTSIIIGLLFGYISTEISIFAGFRLLGLIIIGYGFYYVIFQFKYLKTP